MADDLKKRYIGLLKEVLLDCTYAPRCVPGQVLNDHAVENGTYWPLYGISMIGKKRMDNLEKLVDSVIEEKIPGDLVETGVWRGGACIMMKALLHAHGDRERQVFVCDSFEGLPVEDTQKYPKEKICHLHAVKYLSVSQCEVENNFRKHGLLDDRVVFVKGFFEHSLPGPIKDRPIAILRLDGDLYSSTIQVLEALYHQVSPGGYVIIDDYNCAGLACKDAVSDFRQTRNITAPLVHIDSISAYWRKE